MTGHSHYPGPNGVAGYFYTKPLATITRNQSVTLVYSIEGSSPVWEVSDPTDMPPATMHLFLWRGGDDLSCKGVMASYRFWAPSGVTLKLGDSQTLTSVLDPSVWTNCYGQHDTNSFAGALENAMIQRDREDRRSIRPRGASIKSAMTEAKNTPLFNLFQRRGAYVWSVSSQ